MTTSTQTVTIARSKTEQISGTVLSLLSLGALYLAVNPTAMYDLQAHFDTIKNKVRYRLEVWDMHLSICSLPETRERDE